MSYTPWNKRWFHVTTNNACFGFAINEKFIVTDVAPIAYRELYGKNVKSKEVQRWLKQQYLSIIEVYPNEPSSPT